MKLVVAIIKPFKLDEVRQALTEIGVHVTPIDHALRIRTGETDTDAL
jgi:nitrogen regulatory protein PII